MAESDAPRTRGFLFADLRGNTRFVEAHGDKAASELLSAYRALVRGAVARFSRAEIRTEGDGLLSLSLPGRVLPRHRAPDSPQPRRLGCYERQDDQHPSDKRCRHAQWVGGTGQGGIRNRRRCLKGELAADRAEEARIYLG